MFRFTARTPGVVVATVVIALVACGESGSPAASNDAPVAAIDAPLSGALYRAGDTIPYSGTATDAEDGSLGATSLRWWAEFHHDTHTHPFLSPTDAASGSVEIPIAGETSDNVWYRFYLRAVDSRGAVDTTYVEIFPQKSTLTITSVPVGRTITLDGQPHTTPYVVLSVVGIQRAIGVTSPQVAVDSTYAFTGWSHGGDTVQTLRTPATNTTYTANFVGTGPGNAPPTVSVTAPAGGSSSVVNAPVTVSANAADGDGTVDEVAFYDGATIISTDLTAPFSVSWTPTVLGTHILTAIATDDDGATTTSATVTVSVTGGGGGDTQAPAATLTAPGDGTLNLAGQVILTATATDNVGVVAVEFEVDGVVIGEDTQAPFADTLPSTASYATGVHRVRARARDAAGNPSPWAASRVTFGGSVDLVSGINRTPYVTGLNDVGTAMAFAPDGRLFLAQKNGQLRVVKNGALLATPFVTLSVNDEGERGLLGVAFDPNFASNNHVYLYYTTTSVNNRISRFTANGDVGGSELVLANLPALGAGVHNGGALHFGPDGKLYVAVGDNAESARAQQQDNVFGKMLRFNSDGTIPTDNPFYGTNTGQNRAVWALGLRNPFTFAFHPTSGRMLINDVGEGTWEEINEGARGRNFGWPTTEGPHSNPAFANPVFAYGHPGSSEPSLVRGSAIVGAAFYDPTTALLGARYLGSYFFADFESRWIYRLDTAKDNGVYAFARVGTDVTDLAVGPDGALYALANAGGWGVLRYAP